jgi:hypothetical protein
MNRNGTRREARSRVLLLVVLALATWGSETAAETFVILSMVGDHLTIVTQRRQTGSHIDVNGYQTFANSDPALDEFASKTTDAIIAKTRPNAASVTIRADPAWYKIRDSWVDAELTGIPELIADIKGRLPPIADAHLRPRNLFQLSTRAHRLRDWRGRAPRTRRSGHYSFIGTGRGPHTVERPHDRPENAGIGIADESGHR